MMIDTAAARLHMRHGQTRGANRGEQRLVEGGLPLGVARLEDAGPAGAPDVVDEDVEAAEGLDGALDHERHAIRRRHIGLDGRDHVRLSGDGLHLEGGLLQGFQTAGAQAHTAPFRDERASTRQTEPATRPRHNGDLVVQS
jgi:hypothetical protein